MSDEDPRAYVARFCEEYDRRKEAKGLHHTAVGQVGSAELRFWDGLEEISYEEYRARGGK